MERAIRAIDTHAPVKNPYKAAKINVLATVFSASVQNIRLPQMNTQGIVMLKTPNLETRKVGTTRPIALVKFRATSCSGGFHYSQERCMEGRSESKGGNTLYRKQCWSRYRS